MRRKRLLFCFVFSVLLSGSFVFSVVDICKAYNPNYTMTEYLVSDSAIIDGKWTMSEEWNFGPAVTMSNNASFSYVVDTSVRGYQPGWIVEFFGDNTNDAEDFWQVCLDPNFSGGTAPQIGDFKIEITGHTTLKLYEGNGSRWIEISAEDEFTWNNSISASPRGSTPHWVLELRENSMFEGIIQREPPPFGMRIAAYDASSDILAAWAPNSNVNIPEEWGLVENYSTPITAPTPTPTSTPTLAPQTVDASVQRVALAELFTATWCGFCPFATQALNELLDEYGSTRLLVLQYHPEGSDVFGTAESQARVGYYGIGGYPTAVFDGINQHSGGGISTYDSYKAEIDNELLRPAEVSISLTGVLTDFIVSVTPSNSIQRTSAKLQFVVYEDNIAYEASNGESLFRFTVRTVLNEEAVALVPGQTISVGRDFVPDAGWNGSNLGLVVFVQKDDTHEVLQATTFQESTADFSLTASGTAKTVQANETAIFSALLTNTGAVDDIYNLTLTSSLPSGWVAGFCIEGMCYWDFAIIPVKSSCSQNITISIVASENPGSGRASLEVISQNNPAAVHLVTTPDVTLLSNIPSSTASTSPSPGTANPTESSDNSSSSATIIAIIIIISLTMITIFIAVVAVRVSRRKVNEAKKGKVVAGDISTGRRFKPAPRHINELWLKPKTFLSFGEVGYWEKI